MGVYLGDFAEDAVVNFKWNTFDSAGASITRLGSDNIHVYKDDATGTEVQTGVTDSKDFDSLTGVHHCKIDLSAAVFYAVGADYTVVLKGDSIDGQTVNAVLAHFSIENRFTEVDTVKVGGSAIQQTGGYIKAKNEYGNGIAPAFVHYKISDDVTNEGAATTTSAYFTPGLVEAMLSVGDLMLWGTDEGAGDHQPWRTVITAISGNQITWAPALKNIPSVGDTVYFMWNDALTTLQRLAIPASPTADSVNERIKAIDDKLPAGDIADQVTLEIARKLLKNKLAIDLSNSKAVLYDDDDSTPLYECALTDSAGAAVTAATTGPINRGDRKSVV